MCRKPVIEKALNLIDVKCNLELEDCIQRVWNYFIVLDKLIFFSFMFTVFINTFCSIYFIQYI
jgi:hypothetical protein